MDTTFSSPMRADNPHCDALFSASAPADLDGHVSASCPTAAVPRGPPLFEPELPQPFPLPPASPEELPSPLQERRPDLGLSFAGNDLPSTAVSLPTPPIVKTSHNHNLRLPSFDLLGIAAPHPDRIHQHSIPSFSPLGAGPLSKPEDPLHALSPPLARPQPDGTADPFAASPKAARARVEHFVPVFTPPTEPGTLNWGSFVNVRPVGLGSPPTSEPGVSPNLTTTADASSAGPTANIVVPIVSNVSTALGMEIWVQRVKDILAAESGCQNLDFVKLLSHALPCPSITGHIFGRIISALHESTTANTAWINVFHAVPGRFTLSDLPKSPPSTPGPAVGGDEYFTSKVFDSAVAIPDYQLESKLLPPSPRPVVPPGSVHISIVERYIPPTNTNEYAEMFLLKGRSLLHDRLVELSNNGLLVFIYPTKTGARTFMHDYLGPIIDPLLRSLTVVHELPSELCSSLGRMSSVAYLDEYESLGAQLERFCKALSESASAYKSPTYTVIHASKEEAALERSAWANDWWIKQEKPRIRETVSKYFRQMKKLPESEMTGTHLIQEVLDGVANRKQEDDDQGSSNSSPKGVEVGVFIVKKTM